MKLFALVIAFACSVVTPLFGAPVRDVNTDREGAAMLQQAHKRVTAYHAGQPRSEAVLRVVYFHPSDRDPLPNFSERLDRILQDVNEFYRDGLVRFGITNQGLALERKDGRLVLHVVRGKSPASAYNYDSGRQTTAEIRSALKDAFDLDREHVLVIYGLCRKEPDGRYVFDAPYYGSGTQRNGLCHAADCELLDPLLLTDTARRMEFTEHYYPRVRKSVAGFNTMYLGGVAHELGHALGLFHDAGMTEETARGTSLMGSGNHHYRNELRGEANPAFLARVSALHLLSHPLITRSDRGRWEEHPGAVKDVKFRAMDGALHMTGRVTGSIAPYAMVAYIWRVGQTDHSSRTFPIVLGDEANGQFDLAISGLRPDIYFMRLTSLHVNGGATWEDYHFGFNAAGQPTSPVVFQWPWVVAQAAEAVLKRDSRARILVTDAVVASASWNDQRFLRVLQEVLDPKAPVALDKITDETAFLSDVQWRDAKVGWGKVARNHYWFDEEIQNGVFLMLGGELFSKGLYAHAPSRFVYDLDGKWSRFTATVGLRDGAADIGSAVFRVMGDGRELYRSPVLRVGSRAVVDVPIAKVKKLELVVTGGEGHNHNAWSIWAVPTVHR